MTIQAPKLCENQAFFLVGWGEAITTFRRGFAGCFSFFVSKGFFPCSSVFSKAVVMLKAKEENGEKVGCIL